MFHLLRTIALIFTFAFAAVSAQAKDKENTVYMFGVSTSFNNDTTQYITFVQAVPSATLQQRTNFLENRSTYSAQLEQYLKATYAPNQTAAVFFSTNRHKLEKKYLKVRRKFYNAKPRRVVEIAPESFRFQ